MLSSPSLAGIRTRDPDHDQKGFDAQDRSAMIPLDTEYSYYLANGNIQKQQQGITVIRLAAAFKCNHLHHIVII